MPELPEVDPTNLTTRLWVLFEHDSWSDFGGARTIIGDKYA